MGATARPCCGVASQPSSLRSRWWSGCGRSISSWRRSASSHGSRCQTTVKIAGRHPELLDLAQGPLQSEFAQLVLHPDPELSVIERQVLKASHPRLHLVTPTTVFRRLLARDDAARGARGPSAAGMPRAAGVASPFEGLQVAMSLSVTAGCGWPGGLHRRTRHRRDDPYRANFDFSRAAIAYGGNFRADPKVENYTIQLAQLIRAYNMADTEPARHLHSYLASSFRRRMLRMTFRSGSTRWPIPRASVATRSYRTRPVWSCPTRSVRRTRCITPICAA